MVNLDLRTQIGNGGNDMMATAPENSHPIGSSHFGANEFAGGQENCKDNDNG